MSWVRPTGHIAGSGWTDETKVYDVDADTPVTAASKFVESEWSSYIELTISPNYFSGKIRFYANGSYNEEVSIDIKYASDHAYHNIYEGAFTANQWVEVVLPLGVTEVEGARLKFRHGASDNFYLYEFAFWGVARGNRWVRPTGFIEGAWSNEINAIDGNTTSFATRLSTSDVWTEYLELIISPAIRCSKIRYWIGINRPSPRLSVDVKYASDDSYYNVYEGPADKLNQWSEKNIPGGTKLITGARIKCKGVGAVVTNKVYEFELWSVQGRTKLVNGGLVR